MDVVGRGSEVDRVVAVLEAARSGAGSCVDIVAGPGTGKTALLGTLADRARQMGFRVHAVTITEWETDFPWSMLSALLGPFASGLDVDDDADRELHELIVRGRPDGAVEPFRVALTALRLASRAASEAPLALFVDDIHWADRASVSAFSMIARRVADEPIVLVTGRRPSERFPDLSAQRIDLAPLTDAAAHDLLKRLGVTAPSLRSRICGLAGGLPLVLRAAADSLTVQQREGTANAPDVLPIGRALQQWYTPQLDTLSTGERTAALVAAAEAHGDLSSVLAAIRELGGSVTDLAAVENVGIIAIDQSRLTFVHPTARAAVYETATPAERRTAHAALVTAIGEHDQLNSVWHRLRSHIGTDESIARAAEHAALHARGSGAFHVAADLMQRAAECSPAADARSRRWLIAAQIAQAAGDSGTAAAALAEVDRGPIEPGLVAPVRCRQLLNSGDFDGAVSFIMGHHESLADRHPAAAINLLVQPIGLFLSSGRVHQMLELADLADNLVARLSLTESSEPELVASVARARIARGVALSMRGQHGPAEADLASWPDVLSLEGAAGAASFLAETVGLVYAFTNRKPLANAMLDQLLDASRRVGSPSATLDTLSALATIAYGNDFALCAGLSEQVLTLSTDIGQPGRANTARGNLVFAHAVAIDEPRCRALAASMLATNPMTEAVARCALAKLEIGLDRYEAALCHFEILEAPELRKGSHLNWNADHAECLVRLGRHDEAELPLARLQQRAAHGDQWSAGNMLRIRALAVGGDEATALFEQAVTALARNDNRYALSVGYLHWGEHVRRLRRRSAARELLAQALDGFRRCGAIGWADRAARELALAGGSAISSAPSTADLSQAEQEVASLVGQGASNKDIAARLFISPRTVETHITSIYRKLGIKGRGALAAWVTTLRQPE